MEKEMIFKGVATAIVTPLNDKGVDYEAFGRLIEFQIASGVNALVVAGTTGESPTLNDEEHREVIGFAVQKAAGRVPIIAGTGSNDTSYAVERTRHACEAGADGLLCVTPYYNKTTQRGLVKMYEKIADNATKPIILYNVPSRTGVNIEPETYLELSKHPMISGIKEANGNISSIAKTASLVGDNMYIYSGNDDQIVPILSLGGKGVISVISNILPQKTVEICSRFFSGDVKGSLELQLELLPLMNQLFCEVNPIPVKAAVSAMGYCEDYLRLPLVPMEDKNREKLFALMKEQGIKVN